MPRDCSAQSALRRKPSRAHGTWRSGGRPPEKTTHPPEPQNIMEPKTFAQLAYEALCETRNWKSFTGDPLPQWDEVNDDLKEGWRAAADAVSESFTHAQPPADNAHVAPGCEKFSTPTVMRAKMEVEKIERSAYSETLVLRCRYSDTKEDNSFSEATPSGNMSLCISNRALWGKFNPNDCFYLDFTPAAK